MSTLLDLGDPAPGAAARRRRARTAVVVGLVVVACLLGAGGYAASRVFAGPANYAGSGYGAVVVDIPAGDTAAQVGQVLVEHAVVASVGAFRAAAAAAGVATDLQPGYYRVRHHMSAAAAVTALLDPASLIPTEVVIPPGTPLHALLHLVAAQTTLSLAGLDAVAADPAGRLALPSWAGGQLQGLLCPGAYDFAPGTTPAQALEAMVRRTEQAAARVGLLAGAARLHLTPLEVLTVASLIQREESGPVDGPKIAEVIYNRLRDGMRLQLDSTVYFALGLAGQSPAALTRADLAFPSPYNTYLHAGLPPLPIDSPDIADLRAALHPAAGPWLYFVALPRQDETLFTASYAQFLAWKAELNAQRGG